jgi:glycosyltransferase involved in cell wall biosynthesis
MEAIRDKPTISIIVPALNEEKNIQDAISNTLKAFEDFGIKGEIIVVNDGSCDRTEELVRSMIERDNHIRMLKHDKPRGIGASFWDGVDSAAGDIVVMFPGDGENDPWEIFRYLGLLEQVDIVIPFNFGKQARPFLRNLLSFIYRSIINTTFWTNFNYTNGTILYRKSILKELDYRCNGFFFQTDILIRIAKKGYLFAEVPYRIGVRKSGESKAISFHSLIQVMRGYFNLVKDYYFKRQIKTKAFAADSISAKRYQR